MNAPANFVDVVKNIRATSNSLATLADALPLSALEEDYAACFGTAADGVMEIISKASTDGAPLLSGYYTREGRANAILAVSSMVGCTKHCNFCPLGSRPYIRRATVEEIVEQALLTYRKSHRWFALDQTLPHKLTVAKAGEPAQNPAVIAAFELLDGLVTTFKYSSVLPSGAVARREMERLLQFALRAESTVQLQISLLSTDDAQRQEIAGGSVCTLSEIAELLQLWAEGNRERPLRVPNLSITDHPGVLCSPDALQRVIPPSLAHIRFRPYIPTDNGQANGLMRGAIEHSEHVQELLIRLGYQVSLAGDASPVEKRFNISSVSEISIFEQRLALH